MTTMLDFYQQHQISPVSQDVRDLQAHFGRRAHLYRSLGLPPMAIEGKTVLEVGPGSGHNALYTASLKPKRYVLLEPNDAGRHACEVRFIGRPEIEIRAETMEAYTQEEAFDVVLCEGVLGLAGRDPRGLLDAAGSTVKVGGVLVITCIDAISHCAEVLRRALARRYLVKGASLAENLAALRPVFTPHLATLKGMTRSVDDWILDNILNPASIGPTFSIPDALTQLDGRFQVMHANPGGLLQDWRWYKDAPAGNQWAIDSYWKQCHNLIDCRTVGLPRSEDMNRATMERCEQARVEVAAVEHGGDVTAELAMHISKLENDLAWFGRGQQYLSFVRTT